MDITLPDQQERSSTSDIQFPSLIKWRNDKLRDLCYIVATFFNYLAEPREGFSPVESITTDSMAVRPIITREMVNYVLGEIFPCSVMIKEDHFSVFRVPQDLHNEMERLIKTSITNKSYITRGKKADKGLSIDPGVIQTIWTYLSNGVDAMSYNVRFDETIALSLVAAEANTLARRNCNKNYGFNDDAENCAFQAILYIVIALSDWLETDEITKAEVITAYKIIVPPDIQVDLKPTENKKLEDIISSAIVSKDLIPTPEAIGLILTMMTDVNYYINTLSNKKSRRIMSRYLSLCQPV